MRKLLLVTVVGAILMAASVCWSGIPHLIHYQGMLTDDEGTPLNTPQDITFRIYNDLTDGTLKWSETQYGIMVTDGLFNVNLGDSTPIDLAFDEDYWLEMDVGPGEILTPRVQLTSVGYAYRAEQADTAAYAQKSATADNDWIFRITDTADTTLMTGGQWGIARSGNVLYGNADSTHVNLGVACTTGTSGENYEGCTVGGGSGNTASGDRSTVGGGWMNSASGHHSTVGGGWYNKASDWYATMGGGYYNLASGDCSTVGGGYQNNASGEFATVGGGWINTASGDRSTVGGGEMNHASGDRSTVGGGWYNHASGDSSTVGGGSGNTASGDRSTVGGGWMNTASGLSSTVGGGCNNVASDWYATVGGGKNNTASNHYPTVGGGRENTASGYIATVGGGYYNLASGYESTVGGGTDNIASGYRATVAGGGDNTAAGYYSFATGYRAKANHNGTFVWGDSTGADFTSTGSNQFLIRASGGVGIGTNNPGSFALAVNGTAAKTGGGTWDTFSDIRLKEIKGPYNCGLSQILKLNPVHYNYKEENELDLPAGGEYVGLIAQDVQKVIPEAVEENNEGYLMLKSDPIIWAMLNAIKELKAENEELKKRIEELESKE